MRRTPKWRGVFAVSDRSSTIAAIATPPGVGERGVIRVSGALAGSLAQEACGLDALPGERHLVPCRFDDGGGAQPATLLWMPGPRSFTREDVAEFHLSGSPILLQLALERLLALGARLAEPGEFTRRAFENGRIDLASAEGILELIEASDRDERRAATALLLGGLSRRIQTLRDELEDLRALCEASLDFDSDDTGHVESSELDARFASIHDKLEEALQWESRRARKLGYPRVVLAGAPNAGKSSLFNALTSEAAIVTAQAGTTRDVLRATWKLGEFACELFDTAGRESATGELEREAQARAEEADASAELTLWVVDATRPVWAPENFEGLLVLNKIDASEAHEGPPGAARVSAQTGAGLDELSRRVGEILGLGGENPTSAGRGDRELSVRHRRSLVAALEELARARRGWEDGFPLEIFAEGLREATLALDGIAGLTTPEDLLDRIFGRFCLGK